LGLQQPNGLTIVHRFTHQTFVVFFKPERHFELIGELINPPKASIVASLFIFGTRIAKANEEFNHGEADFKRVNIGNKKRPLRAVSKR
jgi:hypothetical protein